MLREGVAHIKSFRPSWSFCGGKHEYSADVMGDNWFDRRLAPDFKKKRPSKKKLKEQLYRPTDEEQIQLFRKYNRTVPTHLSLTGYRTNTIPNWSPEEPDRGHPAIKSSFRTVYDLTYGNSFWKKKPIPVGANLLSHPNTNTLMTTEHREAFRNQYHIENKHKKKIEKKEETSSEADADEDDSQESSSHTGGTDTESEFAHNNYTTFERFDKKKKTQRFVAVPNNVLTPTSLLGVNTKYWNPPQSQAYKPLQYPTAAAVSKNTF